MSKFCPSCGAQHEDNALFCGICGTAFPSAEQATAFAGGLSGEPENPEVSAGTFIPDNSEPENSFAGAPVEAAGNSSYSKYDPSTDVPESASAGQGQKTGKKVLKIVLSAAAVVLAAAAAALVLLTGVVKLPAKQCLGLYVTTYDDELIIANGDIVLREALDYCDCYCSYAASFDETCAAIELTDCEGDYEHYLYYYSNGALQEVEIEDTFTGSFELSANGETLAYQAYSNNRWADLYVYQDGVSTLIAEDTDSFCVSPDGSALGYTVMEDDDCIGYIWDGDESILLGKHKMPLAVSNGGKYIYYYRNGTLYVQTEFDEDSRLKIGDSFSGYYFNQDGTEMMAYGYEKSCIAISGKKILDIGSDNYSYEGTDDISYSGSYNYRILNIQHLTDACYSVDTDSGYKVVYLNRSGEKSTVASKLDGFRLASDGRTLVYQKGDSIKKAKVGSEKDPEVVVEEEVGYLIAVSEDSSTVYYVNEDGELCVKEGKKEPAYIADCSDAEYAYSLFQGKYFYYFEDGELYRIEKGKPVLIDAALCDGPDGWIDACCNEIIIYGLEDECYYSADGKDFIEIYSD